MVTYRSYKALQLSVGIKIRKIYLAYSFEGNLSPVFKYNLGSHGIHVGVNMGTRRLDGF